MNTEVKIFASPQKVAEAFARELAQLVIHHRQKRFDIALSGGSTPEMLFQHLSRDYQTAIPWERIHFWWGDERCVAPDHPDSNYGMTARNLFSHIQVPEENIHRILGENDPEQEAERYGNELKEQLSSPNGWPVFDLIILGMGNDGHTASIFPHQIELLQSPQICAVAIHPESGQKRITITGEVINSAHKVFFLVTGKNKAERISQIMNTPEDAVNLPAFHIAPEQGELIWYLDQDAGKNIE